LGEGIGDGQEGLLEFRQVTAADDLRFPARPLAKTTNVSEVLVC